LSTGKNTKMIFPIEYKLVGVTHCEPADHGDEPIYFATEYLIVDAPGGYSLYGVKSGGEGFLRKVDALTLIARGDEIVKYEGILDSHDRTFMIEKAQELCRGKVNTVLFTSIDRHITFVHKPDLSEIIEIEVIDVVPPEPPWLLHVVTRLERAGMFSDLALKFTPRIIDLRRLEKSDTLFPCSASGLHGKFLDSDTDIGNNMELVGCDISRNIFEERFPKITYRHMNLCPLKAQIYKPLRPFITRCCQSKKVGMISINGMKGAVVHWGASEHDVSYALRTLAGNLRGGNGENSSG